MRSITEMFLQLKSSSTCERYSIRQGDKPAFDQCNNQKKIKTNLTRTNFPQKGVRFKKPKKYCKAES